MRTSTGCIVCSTSVIGRGCSTYRGRSVPPAISIPRPIWRTWRAKWPEGNNSLRPLSCASTCNSNERWVTMLSRRRSKRGPDASLLPGLPIAHAEGWKKQEIKYTWPRSSVVGCKARVTVGSKSILCVAADVGPPKSPGEISIEAARQLGISESPRNGRSEEHTSELQSLMRTPYAVFCLNKKTTHNRHTEHTVRNDST